MKVDKKIIVAIGYIVAGILVAVFKQQVFQWICTGIGALLIVTGIIGLLTDAKKKISSSLSVTSNIIWIVLGIVLIVLAWAVVAAIQVIVGVLLIIYGVYYLGFVAFVDKGKILMLVNGVLYIAVGILLMFNSDPVYIIWGVLTTLVGVLELTDSLLVRKNTENKKEDSSVSPSPDVIDAEVVEEKEVK